MNSFCDAFNIGQLRYRWDPSIELSQLPNWQRMKVKKRSSRQRIYIDAKKSSRAFAKEAFHRLNIEEFVASLRAA